MPRGGPAFCYGAGPPGSAASCRRLGGEGHGTLYVWLPRKVAMESSSSPHHGVWWTGAMVPLQGEEKDRSRYPVMLAILSCSHSLKCARVKSTS